MDGKSDPYKKHPRVICSWVAVTYSTILFYNRVCRFGDTLKYC